MKIDLKYLTNEIIQFRGIMCSKKFTLEQKDSAYNGLVYAYLHHEIPPGKDRETMITLFQATNIEWERRRLYEVFHF